MFIFVLCWQDKAEEGRERRGNKKETQERKGKEERKKYRNDTKVKVSKDILVKVGRK